MNKYQNQHVDRLGRIKQYVITNAITPAIPRATVLLTEVDTLHTGLLDHGSGQEGGLNTFSMGVAQRQAPARRSTASFPKSRTRPKASIPRSTLASAHCSACTRRTPPMRA